MQVMSAYTFRSYLSKSVTIATRIRRSAFLHILPYIISKADISTQQTALYPTVLHIDPSQHPMILATKSLAFSIGLNSSKCCNKRLNTDRLDKNDILDRTFCLACLLARPRTYFYYILHALQIHDTAPTILCGFSYALYPATKGTIQSKLATMLSNGWCTAASVDDGVENE